MTKYDSRTFKKFVTLSLTVLVTTMLASAAQSTLAQAGDYRSIGLKDTVAEPYHSAGNRVTIEVTNGVLDGAAGEFVYDNTTGRKVSQLDWTFDKVRMLNAKLAVRVSNWFKLYGGGSFALTGSSTMDDYDWLDEDRNDWTDWSHHSDTTLKHGHMLDLGGEVSVLDAGILKFSALGGFKWDRYSWDARGGSYIYSTNGNYRNQTGAFRHGDLGISYTQDYTVPYIGIAAEASWHKLNARASLVGSNMVKATSNDTHHFRDLKFEDNFDHGRFLGVDAELSYAMTNYISFVAAYHYQEFKNVRGTTLVEDQSNGRIYTGFGEGASGAEQHSQMFSLGVRYALQ